MSNPAWQPNQQVKALVSVVVDSNGNVQQTVQDGQTGLREPGWAKTNIGDVTPDGSTGWKLLAILTPPSAVASISGLPKPDFIGDADGTDANLILADMIALFQEVTGRTLYPAQVERLLVNLYAYRESLVRIAIQFCGEQNLLAFAHAPMLDYLGQLLGITRLAAQPAVATLEIVLDAALNVSYQLPAGWQVGTEDGQFIFATDIAIIFAPGQTIASVSASCLTAGPDANGYLPGAINTPVEGNSLIASAANTSTSDGGSVPETDDQLRARIQQAPNRFSNAGPAGAYRFFASSLDPSIIDVQVVSPAPGQVDVYILTGPVTNQPQANPNQQGIAGDALIAKVLALLSGDKIRPLTDTVDVLPVVEIDYEIAATVTLYADVDPTSAQAAVSAAALAFATALASRIARNIVPSELVAALSVPGVYSVVFGSPTVETDLLPGQWANCTGISLTFAFSAENS
jgi:phage-related baseplate assembly protein